MDPFIHKRLLQCSNDARNIIAWNNWRKKNKDTLIDLKDADLSGCKFFLWSDQKLPNNKFNFGLFWADTSHISIDLSYSDLNNANLSDTDLTEANLKDSNMFRTNFRNADLKEADLSNSVALRAVFDNSVLVNTLICKTDLNKASFTDANMMLTRVHDSVITGTNISEKQTREGDFVRAIHGLNIITMRS